jgi:hypothetical protein
MTLRPHLDFPARTRLSVDTETRGGNLPVSRASNFAGVQFRRILTSVGGDKVLRTVSRTTSTQGA